jgi:catechol 2,3-dioxygenase-like lactoylglutathione lyase family enzyme
MPDYILLAVENPLKSAALYDRILEAEPVERSDSFVLYVFQNGLKLGLWSRQDVEPAPKPPGGVELSFSLADRDAVLRLYGTWTSLGLKVVQEPTDMDFGFTFVVADPDGHRLRPFARAADPR